MQDSVVESKRRALSTECLRRKNPQDDSRCRTVRTRELHLRPEGNWDAKAPFLAGGAFPEAQRTQRGGIENTASGRLDYVDASGVAGGGEVNAVTA